MNPLLSADRIASCSLSKYRSLPKTGKPNSTEWTVVSSILQYHSNNDQLEVVALGTGTKCLSQATLSMCGDRLNDSHAEVIARRAFLRYIFDQLGQLNRQENSDVVDEEQNNVFTYDRNTNQFHLAKDVSFHFFTTHSPCGDGSIFEDKVHSDNGEPASKKKKVEVICDNQDIGTVIQKDGFTGGKIIHSTEILSDLMVQTVGAIRTKPGRGIRTLSVSCSDKLSRWSFSGIQGALLMSLLARPIYLHSVTVCGSCDVDAIERAIWKRWECPKGSIPVASARFQLHRPVVLRASDQIVFEHEKCDRLQPASCSIVWCKLLNGEREVEVAVSGKRQGVTKKNLNTAAGRVLICKVELLRKYLELTVNIFPTIGQVYGLHNTSTYDRAKSISKDYNEFCKMLKEQCFRCWTIKPDEINHFCC